jgi:putative ABC transport system substrate-binding protein
MDRRRFVTLIGGALAAPLARAQQPARVQRLGIMGAGPQEGVRRSFEPFLPFLAQAGFVEGKNLQVEIHTTPTESAPQDALAAQLAAAKLDVILVVTHSGALALRKAVTTTPVVVVTGADPVAAGLVPSLARPGGNITGVTILSIEVGNKRIELIKEAFPGTRRIHYLNQRGNMHFNEEPQRHAKSLGMSHEPVVIEGGRDLELFFGQKFGAGEFGHVGLSQTNYVLRGAIIEHASRARLPVVYPFIECADEGGLIAYASDLRVGVTRAMQFVVRILKGEAPADIPFEQAMRIVLAVNLKTARALGVKIPQPVLLRADRVIE